MQASNNHHPSQLAFTYAAGEILDGESYSMDATPILHMRGTHTHKYIFTYLYI
jgi:hypothetical protein